MRGIGGQLSTINQHFISTMDSFGIVYNKTLFLDIIIKKTC